MASVSSRLAAIAIDPAVQVPRLAGGGSTAGMAHAVWRPQMQTFLMRQGIEERDYAREIPEWNELVVAVQTDAESEERTAIATLLSARGSSDTANRSSSSAKKPDTTVSAEVQLAKRRVAEMITRARKAFGYLYAALPPDLHQLVADVPQGYAYGIWSFLEKRFRNTDQDSVMALWKKYTSMYQEEDESFDQYKARVDSALELLVHAKQQSPPGLYAALLLWNLRPDYSTAVLTLKTGDRLKDPAKINWSEIADYMAQYERSHSRLFVDDEGMIGDRAMSARGWSTRHNQSNSNQRAETHNQRNTGIECYKCGQDGHYARDCNKRKQSSGGRHEPCGKQSRHHKQGGQANTVPPSESFRSEDEQFNIEEEVEASA